MEKRIRIIFFLVMLIIILLPLIIIQIDSGWLFAVAFMAPIEIPLLIMWTLLIIFSKNRTLVFLSSFAFILLLINGYMFFQDNRILFLPTTNIVSNNEEKYLSPYWTNTSENEMENWGVLDAKQISFDFRIKYPQKWDYNLTYGAFFHPADFDRSKEEPIFPTCVEIKLINNGTDGYFEIYRSERAEVKKYKLDNGIIIVKAVPWEDGLFKQQRAIIKTNNKSYLAIVWLDKFPCGNKEDFDRMLLSIEPAD